MSLEALSQEGSLTPVGLLIQPTMTEDEYETLGAQLGLVDNSMRWAIGDWILAGEAMFGERAYQLHEALGLSVERRKQYLRVAESIPISRRRKELSWSHHRAVVPYEPEVQDRWLTDAVEGDWTKDDLEARIRYEVGPATTGRGASQPRELVPPSGHVETEVSLEQAAREVLLRAIPSADIGLEVTHSWYLVPPDAILELEKALNPPNYTSLATDDEINRSFDAYRPTG